MHCILHEVCMRAQFHYSQPFYPRITMVQSAYVSCTFSCRERYEYHTTSQKKIVFLYIKTAKYHVTTGMKDEHLILDFTVDFGNLKRGKYVSNF